MAGEINPASLKWYHPTTKTEGATHGGAINTSNPITSGVDNNIFDDVSNAEREAGSVEYRKVFFRNENAATYEGVKLWISANTPATNSTVAIALGTSNDVQSTATGYTYVEPTSKVHASVLTIGNLAQNASQGIWIRRTITAGGNGYTDDRFTLTVENS